jgi:serine/threonine-protein kinase
VFETATMLFASWVYGSVNSPFFGVALLFIAIYRLAFDFRIGVTAFSLVFVGLWVIVVLEMIGVLPSQPIGTGAPDGVYALPARQIGAMLNLSFVMALTFVVANWSVGRIRHKDLAIRLLRESLYAIDKARVGRHTGRTLVDTYALGELLGSGGMGEVYVATHLRTQRKVAVKMLHAHLAHDSAILVRFRREAEVMGQLGSEHIVGVIDVGEEEHQPFLVLELVEGESLAARIVSRGALPFDEIADIVDQLAAGLDVAHRAGIVHRDLKPENVFLCKRSGGRLVKILDFGVSKIRGNATALTNEVSMLGTPDYMSPEQALGNADDVDASADVFALGGVVYKALTSHKPFSADSVPALLRQICEAEPPPMGQLRADIPPAVIDVVALAMAKQPADRYQSAPAFAADLRAAFAGTLAEDVVVRARELVRGRPAVARRKRSSTIDVTGETHRR